MTLQAAIERIIIEAGRPLKSTEIANEINVRGLYIKADKTKVSASQIIARVNKYPDIFNITEQGISLHEITLLPYRELANKMLHLLRRMYSFNDESSSRDIVASFLLLIFNSKHDLKLRREPEKSKENLIKAFEIFEEAEPQIKHKLSHVYQFLTGPISEYEAEQIILLIHDFRFSVLKVPEQEEFSSFFNDFINSYSWKSNFRGGEFSTPKVVSKLMCSLYSLPEGATVFDPFAGRASLLLELIKSNRNYIKTIIAGDVNDGALNIGSQNLYATGISRYSYTKGNAFTSWEVGQSADLFISNPPFGVRIEKHNFPNNWQFIDSNDICINTIQLALYHTDAYDGKIIITVPESLLFGTSLAHRKIREMIVSENLLKGVIFLPKNSFKPYSAVSSALLLLDKSKKQDSKRIYFYDASDVLISDFDKEISKIKRGFHDQTIVEDKSRWIESQEVKDKGYELSVKKYLLQEYSDQEYILLEELLAEYRLGNSISADNINKTEGIPYIQVSDLAEGEGIELINEKTLKTFVSDIELVQSTIREITAGSILIAKVGTKLKPTLVNDNIQAIASSNILILKPKSDIIPEYVISQLQSEYVKKQIEVIRRYNTVPNFNLKEFIKIRIKKSDYQQQQNYITYYYSSKIKSFEKAVTKNREEDQYNIISRIKHEVKQPVSSIGIDISVLTEYLKQKETSGSPISLHDYVVDPLEGQSQEDIEETKLLNILNRIQSSVAVTQSTLKKAEETLNIGKGMLRLEKLDVKEFIEKVIKLKYTNVNCKVELSGKECSVLADKYQLEILLSHLIDNALKHGFKNVLKRKDENIIRIELSRDSRSGFIEIVVMNNGTPFSNGFNKSLFETKGATTDRNNGSGFGGYHIRKIIENHGGELEIVDAEELQFSEYKVQFKIYLPLNL